MAEEPRTRVEAPAATAGVALAVTDRPTRDDVAGAEPGATEAGAPVTGTSGVQRRDLVVLFLIALVAALAAFDASLWLDGHG